jgi:hypothetical protein
MGAESLKVTQGCGFTELFRIPVFSPCAPRPMVVAPSIGLSSWN